MLLPQVEVVDGNTLRVEGLGDCLVDDWIMGSEDVLGPASATSLRNAVRRYVEEFGYETSIFLTIEQPHRGNKDLIQPIYVEMRVSGDRICVTATDHLHDDYPIDLNDHEPRYRELLRPLLERHGGRIEKIWTSESPDGSTVIAMSISLSTRRRTVVEIASIGSEFDLLVGAASHSIQSIFAPRSALDVLKMGYGHLIEGQAESEWLESKEMPYVKSDGGKMELAKDVASFASTGQDALIAIGFKRSKRDGQDIVGTSRPFPEERMNKESIRGLLSSSVFPRLEGLDIGTSSVGDGKALGWIFVPAQNKSLLPFLVRGRKISNKVKDNFFSIPHRDGEHTNYSDPEAVHAYIAAGRRYLRDEP